jgi:hypothetical protein
MIGNEKSNAFEIIGVHDVFIENDYRGGRENAAKNPSKKRESHKIMIGVSADTRSNVLRKSVGRCQRS